MLKVLILISVLFFYEANSGNVKSNQLIVERVTGAPPAKTCYLTEDSGAKLRRLKRNAAPGLYIFMNTTKNLPNATTLRSKMYEGHNNDFKVVLIDYKRNLCDYLINEKTLPFSALKTILGLPNKCPVPPGVYKKDNLHVEKYLPAILPAGQGFRVQVAVDFEKAESIMLDIFFRVVKN